MKVDFFKVQMPDNTGNFVDLLSSAAARPNDAERVVEGRGWTVRLQSADVRAGVWEVEMVRIRMDDLPVIASLGGSVEPIDLDEDEGIGEETAFLYSPNLNVIALQRNRFGVSATLFCRYFESIGSLESPIELLPCIETNALERLQSLERVRSYSLRFAEVSDPSLMVKDSHGTVEAIDVLRNATAPSVEITMSMGHQQGTLSIRSLLESARAFFLGRRPRTPSKITVDGVLADGRRTKFDLLNFVMSEDIDVQLDSDRRLPIAARLVALRTAFRSRRNELQ